MLETILFVKPGIATFNPTSTVGLEIWISRIQAAFFQVYPADIQTVIDDVDGKSLNCVSHQVLNTLKATGFSAYEQLSVVSTGQPDLY